MQDQPPGPLSRRTRIAAILRDQRVSFLIIGGVNTVVGFLLFVVLDLTLGRYLDRTVNEVVGSIATVVVTYAIAIQIAFVLHRRFVFRVEGHLWRDLLRFQTVYLVSLGINLVTLPILVSLGMPRIIAQALIIVVTTVLSYVGHRYFSFRRPRVIASDSAAGDPPDAQERVQPGG